MQLGSHVAVDVVQAGSCSSNSTPSLETSICRECGPKEKKKNLNLSKRMNWPFQWILKGKKRYKNSLHAFFIFALLGEYVFKCLCAFFQILVNSFLLKAT